MGAWDWLFVGCAVVGTGAGLSLMVASLVRFTRARAAWRRRGEELDELIAHWQDEVRHGKHVPVIRVHVVRAHDDAASRLN
jgi:hypothetical protein